MRIAQRTVSRNYKASLNRVMAKRANALQRSEDGLRFHQLSEDVAAGARAMNTQEMRYAAIQQKNTAEELIKELDAAWGVMGSMDQTIQDVLEEMKSAAGVRTEEKLEAIQKKVHNLKEEYLQELNTQYSGKYLFGGTNNKEAPFTVNEQDRLLFNGVEVSKIYLGQKMDGLVGDPAADAKYANDSRYYNDGINYYHNDGKYYYDAEQTPPKFTADLSGFSVRIEPDLALTAPAAVDFNLEIGGQPVQVWNGTAWVPPTLHWESGMVEQALEVSANDIVNHLPAGSLRIGNDVYEVVQDDTQVTFNWTGAVTASTTDPTSTDPATGLDTSAAAQKAASVPSGLTLTPVTPAGGGTVASSTGLEAALESAVTKNTKVPYSDAIYLDTGLGLTVDRGTDVTVDPRTAFHVNVVGLELCGFTGFVNGLELDTGAYTQNTIANNIYDMISEVERLLSPGYSERELDSMQMQLTAMNDTMRMARTDVDTRSNSLENMVVRLKTEIDGMEKLEDSLMTADPAHEAIDLKDIEYSWQAVLALGSQILPSSLLDYLR